MNKNFLKGVGATVAFLGWTGLCVVGGIKSTCASWHYTYQDLSIETCEIFGEMPDTSANLTFRKGAK